ncbi:MAG: peptidase [Planctomycetota bacterium]
MLASFRSVEGSLSVRSARRGPEPFPCFVSFVFCTLHRDQLIMRFLQILVVFFAALHVFPLQAQDEMRAARSAVIIPLHEDINPLSGAIFKRKFQQAVASGAEVVILDIRSPGGWTMVTYDMMDVLLEAKDVETVAYIDRDAISGAALFSLAADKIILHPNARMGDAGEIVMGDDGAFRYTEAKSRSVLAQKARDTATTKGRPATLAEKMTNKDMVVFKATHNTDGRVDYFSEEEFESRDDIDEWTRGKPVREAGKEMFFIANGSRLVELGMADRTVESREELFEVLNVKTPVPVWERTTMDAFILILNSGPAAFLLILLGLIALGFELSAPGLGIGGLASLLCFGLFFWSRFLGGTAGWLEVTVFVCGLLFIAAEVFVIPGFGVAGISGLVMTLGSLIFASRRVVWPETGAQMLDLGIDSMTVVGAFFGFLVSLFFLANYMNEIPGLSRLTLKPPTLASAGAAGTLVGTADTTNLPGWQRVQVGEIGRAAGPLRPSGKMQIEDYQVDVVTEGEFVDSETPIKVITKQGSRVVVRPVGDSTV